MVVDQFFNETVQHADIVLPVTTTLSSGMSVRRTGTNWLSVNEPAIKPLYECKSDPEIAALLSAAINKIESGSCTFPQEFNPKKWLDEEFNDERHTQFGIRNWEDLLAGPHKAKMPSTAAWYDRKFKTPSGKYEFKSERCVANGHTALPEYKEPAKSELPFHLFTPICNTACIRNLLISTGCKPLTRAVCLYALPLAASKKGIAEGDKVRVFNAAGDVELSKNYHQCP